MTRILVVEDEIAYLDPLTYQLEKEGFDVVAAMDGQTALERFDENPVDLVLLDLMLPGMSGIQVCRELRRRGQVGVIMLTAKDSEIDKVVGLEIGADDYVTKPYSFRELLARVNALLRRGASRSEPVSPPPVPVSADADEILWAGPVEMNVDQHTVTVSGTSVAMPLKEFELLEELLRNTGRVMTRGYLIHQVWGASYVGDTKTLDVHIKRLRGRIESDPKEPRHILTVRGVGYRIVDEEVAE